MSRLPQLWLALGILCGLILEPLVEFQISFLERFLPTGPQDNDTALVNVNLSSLRNQFVHIPTIAEDQHSLYVGVLSAAKYADTRIMSIHRTWGKEFSGNIHVRKICILEYCKTGNFRWSFILGNFGITRQYLK